MQVRRSASVGLLPESPSSTYGSHSPHAHMYMLAHMNRVHRSIHGIVQHQQIGGYRAPVQKPAQSFGQMKLLLWLLTAHKCLHCGQECQRIN